MQAVLSFREHPHPAHDSVPLMTAFSEVPSLSYIPQIFVRHMSRRFCAIALTDLLPKILLYIPCRISGIFLIIFFPFIIILTLFFRIIQVLNPCDLIYFIQVTLFYIAVCGTPYLLSFILIGLDILVCFPSFKNEGAQTMEHDIRLCHTTQGLSYSFVVEIH